MLVGLSLDEIPSVHLGTPSNLCSVFFMNSRSASDSYVTADWVHAVETLAFRGTWLRYFSPSSWAFQKRPTLPSSADLFNRFDVGRLHTVRLLWEVSSSACACTTMGESAFDDVA